MKTLFVFLMLSAGLSFAQIVVTPPVPPSNGSGAVVKLTAGTIACTLTGSVPPLLQVAVQCTVGGATVAYDVFLGANQNYTLNYALDPTAGGKNFDSVTCLLYFGTALKYDCATLSNGMEHQAAGAF